MLCVLIVNLIVCFVFSVSQAIACDSAEDKDKDEIKCDRDDRIRDDDNYYL